MISLPFATFPLVVIGIEPGCARTRSAMLRPCGLNERHVTEPPGVGLSALTTLNTPRELSAPPTPRSRDMRIDDAAVAGALLADRVAVVTGGGGGIGAATARLFAQHGARVVIADIDSERAQQTADEITTACGSALASV